VKNALKNGMTVDAARAADDSVPLKQLATQIVAAGVS
jgi:hypothetical protein